MMKHKQIADWHRTVLLLLFGAMPMLAQLAVSGPDFSYSGDKGPGFWEELSPQYSACAENRSLRQSPIDIQSAVEDPTLRPLDLILSETSFTLENPGYTIIAYPAHSGMLVLEGNTYHFKQFHFHTISEHTFQGRHTAMEMHAVFEDASEHYAVIAVLYRAGSASAFLEKLLNAGLPQKTSAAPITVNALNLEQGLTDTSSYYTYAGSFTTPPCSEIVTWLVLKKEAQASLPQLEAFRRILGNDFRPLQNLNQRVIRATPNKSASEEEPAQ